MIYETRAVLAAAYPGETRSDPKTTMLTHTVEVDDTDRETDVRVLCKRVKLDSMCDIGAADWNAKPTCPTCLRRDPRFQ